MNWGKFAWQECEECGASLNRFGHCPECNEGIGSCGELQNEADCDCCLEDNCAYFGEAIEE